MSPRTLLGASPNNKNNCCIYRGNPPKTSTGKAQSHRLPKEPQSQAQQFSGVRVPTLSPPQHREGWNHHESTKHNPNTTFFHLEQRGTGARIISKPKTLQGQNRSFSGYSMFPPYLRPQSEKQALGLDFVCLLSLLCLMSIPDKYPE